MKYAELAARKGASGGHRRTFRRPKKSGVEKKMKRKRETEVHQH
jgi:hypothetical protein